MKTKCIIVDDEPLAIEALLEHIQKITDLDVEATCSDAVEAFEVLQKKRIDLIFLDINMPELSGLDFLKSLKTPPKVIFTTAYREFAVDAFELDVVDYLVKPISFERFIQAVQKYYQRASEGVQIFQKSSGDHEKDQDFILVKADKKMQKINLDEILFIESLKDYCKIICTGKTIISKVQISEMEDRLPGSLFVRIHRSFIVSLKKINAFSTTHVELHDHEIPIGRMYKNIVQSALKGYLNDV